MMSKEECEKAYLNIAFSTGTRKCEYNSLCDECLNECETHKQYEKDCEVIEQLIKEHFEILAKIKTGELNDGYHTFNELYYHRAVLFSIICNEHKDVAYKSKKHHDGTMYDGMFVVGINTPQGQYSYHYDLNVWSMFDVPELEFAPEWDGHKPSDIERLRSINNAQPYKFEDLKEEMWVWDNEKKEVIYIDFIKRNRIYFYTCKYDDGLFHRKFQENRFFPVQMANVRCE